jgi:hypothetical protein
MKRKNDLSQEKPIVKRRTGNNEVDTIHWSGGVSSEMAGYFKKKSWWDEISDRSTRDSLMKIVDLISTGQIERKKDTFKTGWITGEKTTNLLYHSSYWKRKQYEWESQWLEACFVCHKTFSGDQERTEYYKKIMQINGPDPGSSHMDKPCKWGDGTRQLYLSEKNSHPHYYALQLVAEPRQPVCWACHRIIT